MELIELVDEVGNVDLCEVVQGTRVKVIRRLREIPSSSFEDRLYSIQYAHACGYRD